VYTHNNKEEARKGEREREREREKEREREIRSYVVTKIITLLFARRKSKPYDI
jgi:hypothetical protein